MSKAPRIHLERDGTMLLAGLAAVITVVVLVVAFAPLSLIAAARLSWLASIAFSAGTLVAARRLVRRLRRGDPARRFWWAICFSAVTSGVAYLVQFVTAHGPQQLVLGPVSVTVVGVGTVVVVGVLSTYPLRIRSGQERFCFWLDMATVMICSTAFAWYFTTVDDSPPGLLNVLTGPVAMLVAVFAVAKLLIAGRPPFGPYTGLLGAAAAVIGGVIGVWAPSAVAGGTGHAMLAVSAVGDSLMTAAIWLQWLQPERDAVDPHRPRRPYSVLPYLAVACTFVLLVRVSVDRGMDAQSIAVLAGASLSTAVVVMRQVASFADNARLLRELDVTVAELRETGSVLRGALAERDALAERLHDLAYQDSLTGLANRALFHERLAEAFRNSAAADRDSATAFRDSAAADRDRAAADRDSAAGDRPVAVMLLDLDKFKPINDDYGHAAGDALLRHVAGRLRSCLRETDTIARLGGDEFAVLLADPLAEDLAALAERVVVAVRQPCLVDGVELAVGASVGTALARAGDSDPDLLLRSADAAMYAVKNGSRSAPR
ncbi:GGDEF domain-containing protein [Actinoplanes awajinensis]|uniref:GGDEF domain-containing protein n=1 Tax=Actinoplanes awajinensis subsp. mycoplanecinus TaxID=135947 RepID=A0A101JAS2_9ACTN|nr:GGDEF domain-containing protein [Actinoplanes awajinensis]KUL23341.1 hypothetical protein ADL15_46515 [Actinoplanes awajinensis subsp. mycoplanecinus]